MQANIHPVRRNAFRNPLILLFSIISFMCLAQNGSVRGKITSSDGKAAEFVTVGLTGTNLSAITNEKGEYHIEQVKPGSYTLQVNMIGLESKSQVIEMKENGLVSVDFSLTETSRQLKEVVIVGTKSVNEKPVNIGKVAIKPMDLPQSTAVIEKEVFEQQQVLRVSDALKNVNGIYMMGNSGGTQEEIAGRGFAFNSSNTFKNGVRFNNSTMPEMNGIERMEVMKGSTAILFGNVAAGGVINLVTKKPQFEKGGEVTFRAGSYDFYKPSLDVFGGVTEFLAYRVNTSYEKSRSFRDQVKGERFYINPSFLLKLGQKTDVLIEGDYLNDDRTSDFGVGAINYQLIDVPRDRFLGVAWSYFKTEQKSLTATITHHFNENWKIRSVSSYQEFSSDLFGSTRPNSNSQVIRTDGRWIRGLQRTEVKENYAITQLDLTGRFNTWSVKHNLLFGADFDNYSTNNTAYNGLSVYDTINVFDASQYTQRNDIPDLTKRTLSSSPVERVGVYLQDLISLTKKIKLLAGVRFSYLETQSNVLTYSTDVTVSSKQFDHAFTPRFGLVYQPLSTMALFASYSNSFTPNTGVDVDGKALAPSMIDQYELGIKNDLFRGALSANVTAYQIVNSNLAQTSLANGNTNSNIKELAGEVTSQGIEVDIMSKSWKGVSLIAGYSFNETRYTRSNTYIEGSRLRYNPSHTANASIYYMFSSSSALSGLNAGVSALYFGERFAGRSTRVTVPNDAFTLIRLAPFTQLDASIGYTKNKFAIKVKVSNLLDEMNYHVHDDNSVNPIAPRQFATTVSFKF